MLFTARGRDGFLIMLGIKAEIKGFMLLYRLFLYQQWFFHKLEVSRILVLSDAPCNRNDLLTKS